MAFTDLFNYSNGPLGAPWTIHAGTPTVSGGEVSGEGFLATIGAGWDPSEAHIHLSNTGVYAGGMGPAVKVNAGGTEAYACVTSGDYSQYHVRILKLSLGSWNIIHTDTVTGDPTNVTSVGLTWDNGTLTSYVNGSAVGTHDDGDYSANMRVGFYGGSTTLHATEFTTSSYNDPNEVYLTIEPEEVWVANPVNFLQATIHGADWSDVTDPGTGLTADKGFVASSYLETDTIQSFSWAPLVQTGTITITDPVTHATGTFTSTLYPPQNSGGSYPLEEDGAGILNATGESCPDGLLLTTCTTVDYNGGPLLGEALDTILYQLGGYSGQTVPDIGSVSLPSLIYELFAKQGEAGYWTVPELIDLLGGSPTVYSHADLKTAIDNIPGGDNQDVLDALAAYFGANPPTIEQLGTMVSDIATIAGYTLGDVLDAIAAIPGVDLSAIITKLDLIQPSEAADLTTITNQLTTIDGNVDDVENSLAAVRTGNNLTLQDVIDAINGLTVTAPPAPPVWPGVGSVTLGTPVALDDGVHLTGTMDGVIIAITTPPAKTGRRDFGGVVYYYGLGELAFETDDGDLEMWQYMGFPAMIATPKSMQHAGGVRVRMPSGGSGTITPWTAS